MSDNNANHIPEPKEILAEISPSLSHLGNIYILDLVIEDYLNPVFSNQCALIKFDENVWNHFCKLPGLEPILSHNKGYKYDLGGKYLFASAYKIENSKAEGYLIDRYANTSHEDYQPVLFSYDVVYGDWLAIQIPRERKLHVTIQGYMDFCTILAAGNSKLSVHTKLTYYDCSRYIMHMKQLIDSNMDGDTDAWTNLIRTILEGCKIAIHEVDTPDIVETNERTDPISSFYRESTKIHQKFSSFSSVDELKYHFAYNKLDGAFQKFVKKIQEIMESLDQNLYGFTVFIPYLSGILECITNNSNEYDYLSYDEYFKRGDYDQTEIDDISSRFKELGLIRIVDFAKDLQFEMETDANR